MLLVVICGKSCSEFSQVKRLNWASLPTPDKRPHCHQQSSNTSLHKFSFKGQLGGDFFDQRERKNSCLNIRYWKNNLSCTHSDMHVERVSQASKSKCVGQTSYPCDQRRKFFLFYKTSAPTTINRSDLHSFEAACPCLSLVYHFLSRSLVVRSASCLRAALEMNRDSELNQTLLGRGGELHTRLAKQHTVDPWRCSRRCITQLIP